MGITAGFMVPHPPLIVQEIGRGEEQKIHSTTLSCRQAGREIAALHNGRSWFENRPEGGACVTVELRGGRR